MTGPLRVAFRLLGAGWRDGWWLLLCLAVSVAALTGARVTSHALHRLVDQDVAALLGGDLRVQSSQPLDPFWQREDPGRRWSAQAELVAHVRSAAGPVLAELKAVDDRYPLRGQVVLRDGLDLQTALADGGVVVEAPLLARLGIDLGARVRVGDLELVVRGVVESEPDRVTSLLQLGPRAFIALPRLAETGLVRTGSRVRHVATIQLAPGENPETVAVRWRDDPARANLRVITPVEGQPMVRRHVERFDLYLNLAALLTLLVGAGGVAVGMAAWIREQRGIIAIGRALGASHRQVTLLLVWQILMVAAVGGWLGALAGMVVPRWLIGAVQPMVPSLTGGAWSLADLLWGVVWGVVAGVVLAVEPLRRVRTLSPGVLFREGGEEERVWLPNGFPWPATLILTGGGAWLTGSGWSAAWFTLGAGLALGLFDRTARWGLAGLRRIACRGEGRRGMAWRLAVRNLLVPDHGAMVMIVAMGLGLGVAMSVVLLAANFHHLVIGRLPDRAPSFYCLDLQSDQRDAFLELAAAHGGRNLRLDPVVRGRLSAVNGQPPPPAAVNRSADRWRFQREYVLTFAGEPLPNSPVVEGRWWRDGEESGASVEWEMAKSLNWRLGDRLTFDIQGVAVTVPIVSFRRVNWGEMGLNYFVVLSPKVLAGAPFALLATLVLPVEREEVWHRELAEKLVNVTAIPTRQVLGMARAVVERIAVVAVFMAGVTVLAALLTLQTTLAATRRLRGEQWRVCRLLGAGRWQVWRFCAIESWLLAGLAATVAVVVAQGVVHGVMVWGIGEVAEPFWGLTLGLWWVGWGGAWVANLPIR